MPTLARDGALLHYDDLGAGELVVMLHGLNENALYWSSTGIAGRLSSHYRVVLLEMRGHGRTVSTAVPEGFDERTLGEDVEAIADHLGYERFHLVSHATGGMVAVRLAMRDDTRLASLTLTDTGAATWPGREDPREAMAPRFDGRSWSDIFESLHAQPGLFLSQLDEHPDSAHLWELFEAMARLGNPDVLARFIRSFYDDPDPHVDKLQGIRCPTLVLLGERDRLFVKPSRLLAAEIPGATHVVLPGVGHMTAFEAPDVTYDAIASFLAAHPASDDVMIETEARTGT